MHSGQLSGYRLILAAAAAGALAFAAACANPAARVQSPSAAEIGQESAPTPVKATWGRG